MQPKALVITPLAGVVDDNGVVDAVLGVIHLVRAVGVDDLDVVAIGDDRLVFLVHRDGAAEGAVHGITAQQTGALFQVVLGAALADNDGAQAQVVPATGFFHEDPGQVPADPAEAVQHDVLGLALAGHLGFLVVPVDHRADRFTQEVLEALLIAHLVVLVRKLTNVDVGLAQVQAIQRLENRVGIVNIQLFRLNLAHESVCLEDVDDRLVDQRAAVHRGHHIVAAVQTADQRNHGFGDGFTLGPVGKVAVELLLAHDQGPLKQGVCRVMASGPCGLAYYPV